MGNIENGYLFTDQYELTMAQLYYKMGYADTTAVFDHFFRRYPDYGNHRAGYCIYAGLESFLEWLTENRFGKNEIDALKSQKDKNGKQVFDDDFLEYLKSEYNTDNICIRAVEEGRIVHINETITTVRAPAPIAQLIETALLNIINFQTLIATKAARIKYAAKDSMVMEFGARRAHGPGANAAVRAALIGGADYSSNVGISHKLNIAPKGTHAHSMVQFFLAQGCNEYDAFKAYADLYPDNCILLVDTIDTMESGLPNAIRVFEELKRKGHKPIAVRLDSGNLSELAVKASEILDRHSMESVSVVLSGDLDETAIIKIHSEIRDICKQGSANADTVINRLTYGVGTKLITSAGDSSLSGVYKLSAAEKGGELVPIIKLSDTSEKTNNPGEKELYRVYKDDIHTADIIALKSEEVELKDYAEELNVNTDKLRKNSMLRTVFENNKIKTGYESIEKIRAVRDKDLEGLPEKYKQIEEPAKYPVLQSHKLSELKTELENRLRGKSI